MLEQDVNIVITTIIILAIQSAKSLILGITIVSNVIQRALLAQDQTHSNAFLVMIQTTTGMTEALSVLRLVGMESCLVITIVTTVI